jgi:hypothetical protein
MEIIKTGREGPIMSHTPGPWSLHVWSYGASIEGAEERVGWVDANNRLNWMANARLIAAAPDLLEALIAVKNALSISIGPDGIKQFQVDALCLANAAIAKVEGKK